MLRLWPVALAALALTMVSAVFVASRVAPTYEAEATMLLISPAVTEDPDGVDVATNPFVLSGPAERIAATSVLAVTESEQWVAAMRSAGAEGDYAYALSAEAPIVVVSSAADTPDGALHTLDVASRLFQEELEHRQRTAGAPADRLIGSEVLSSTQVPATVVGSRVRALAAVAALGVVATGTILFLLDWLAPEWQPSMGRVWVRRRTAVTRLLVDAAASDGSSA